LGCGADPKPPQSAGSGEKKASAVAETALSDEAQVRGHWVCVESIFNGQPEVAPGTIHALFTDKELKLSYPLTAEVFEYHLDPHSQPKHCDLLSKFSLSIRAIYSLEDGKLRICEPSVIKNNTPYPASFESGTKCVVRTFKRVEKETRIDEASLSPQQKEVLAGQRKELAANIRRLEEKKYLEFFEHIAPPNVRDGIKQRKNGIEETLKLMEERGPVFAKLLRILSNEVPTFNSDATRATYDLRAIHVNGFLEASAITFVKAGDRWYMDDPNRYRQGK
jgi:uncharacterized protein (TIGR03067 family)